MAAKMIGSGEAYSKLWLAVLKKTAMPSGWLKLKYIYKDLRKPAFLAIWLVLLVRLRAS